MDVQLMGLCGGAACAGWFASYAVMGCSRQAGGIGASKVPELGRWLEQTELARRLEAAGEVERRRGTCLKEMPQMLDIITLGLHSGLSFDASLELYCSRCEGELSQAFYRALISWRIGTCSREEALGSLSDELDVVALKRFASVVSQALEFGSPLAQTLESQAEVIREEQRSQIEEAIERVPVRMLLPLGTLIVPAMLLSILGPLLGANISLV